MTRNYRSLTILTILFLSGCDDPYDRYLECLDEAANAPTKLGVELKVSNCDERYDQAVDSKASSGNGPIKSGI